MKLHSALGRLLWRPAVLLDFYISCAIAAFLPFVLEAFLSLLNGDFLEVTVDGPSALAADVLVPFLGASVVGVVASFAWQDLCHCRSSWNLPGLRERMRVELWILATLTAVGFGLASPTLSAQLGFVLTVAMAIAGFGWGLHLWDPHSSRVLSVMALASCLVIVHFAETLGEFWIEWPWASLTALGACGLSIHQSTSRGASRRRALVPENKLGASFERYGSGSSLSSLLAKTPKPRARWTRGPIASTLDRVWALRYEDAGCVGPTWYAQTILSLSTVTVLGVVGGFSNATLPITALLIAMFSRLDLRRGQAHPVSRSERSRIVWLGARQQFVLFVVACTLANALARLGVWIFKGDAFDVDELFRFCVFTVFVAAALPLLQFVRLHALDARGSSASSLRFVTTLLIASVVFSAAVMWIEMRMERYGLWPQVALALGTLACLPLAFRLHVQRWFRTADLT